MAFDQNSDLPVVNPHKKTTQVNIWMIVAVLVFFGICGLVYFQFARHRSETVNQVRNQQETQKTTADH
ncbi:MAG TPA: hypothetical protein VG838_18450 [Opitutaceae bacterium]|nr:hypothetical protein [Opitutaceae bacterium]